MHSSKISKIMVASLAGSIMCMSASPVLAASSNSIIKTQHFGIGQLKKLDQSVSVSLPSMTINAQQSNQGQSVVIEHGSNKIEANQSKAEGQSVTINTASTNIQANQLVSVKNPAGNNGTVKIDGQPFDMGNENDPHVGCTFGVKFFNFDQGNNYADVNFELQAPTKSGQLSVNGNTRPFIGGGDTEQTYSLNFAGVTPQANQGYHVKLTIHADGSQGSNVKHKVFWVKGCQPAVGGVIQPTVTPQAPAVVAATTKADTKGQVLGTTLPDTGSKSNQWVALAGIVALISGALVARNGRKFNLNF